VAGYLIVPEEACDWSGNQSGKLVPNPIRLGLFDLIREFDQDPFPFSATSRLCLIRLDDLLVQLGILEAQSEDLTWPLLAEVRRKLAAVANEVNVMPTIHVPIGHSLVLGGNNRLFVNYAWKRIPLWRIFGSKPSVDGIAGKTSYQYAPTLS